MTIEWLVNQIVSMTHGPCGFSHEPPRRFKGSTRVIRANGATERVLVFLRAHPDRFFQQREIRQATRCTHGAVSWALVYLQAMELVEVTPDVPRNERYLRYRAARPRTEEKT